ncbi:SusD/RagB family nutrient-binding outer membrane lipoprotein [Kaistella sp.]|uniref:SusD/RagB family nutrient-binding outer membrane lipoprotein n=1 Tax=Kaistella sp. TaxID=2782235 RepID=UPI003C60EE3C
MKKIILPLLATGFLFVGCTRDEINTDPNSAYTTIPTTLITYTQKALSDHVTTPNVNTNNFRLTMQYWNETLYMQESQYDFASRSVSNQIYSDNYVLVLNNLTKAKGLINDYAPTATEAVTWPKVKANQLAIIDIMMVYTFQNLVDIFGNIPYSEANMLATITTPKYDDAATIYSNLISRLDADINSLDVNTTSNLGTADIYYGGNVSKWKKFGSSVLLKLGVTLADVNPTLAQSTASKAISYGLITDNADNCLFQYLAASPNYSPIYANVIASGREDYVAGKTIIDFMQASGDTRIGKYFQKSTDGGIYKGAIIGVPASLQGGVSNLSLPGTFASTTTTPGILMNATEVNFYLAEAAKRWALGSPATYYNAAINASFSQWGIPADADAYLTAHPYDDTNWKKSIGEQAWVALYNQPYTAWNTWRRLDFPILTAATNAAPASEGKVPVRMVYAPREASTNGANVASAATAIGGDKLTTKLFWDKN